MKLYFFPSPGYISSPTIYLPHQSSERILAPRYTGRYSRSFLSVPFFDFVILWFTATSGSHFHCPFFPCLLVYPFTYILRYIFLFCIYLLSVLSVCLLLTLSHPFFPRERDTHTRTTGTEAPLYPGASGGPSPFSPCAISPGPGPGNTTLSAIAYNVTLPLERSFFVVFFCSHH